MRSRERTRVKVALRQQILDAARDLFVHDGYDAVSMRRIAARIEYSPTAIYLHFPDKQSILSALCDETFDRLSARLTQLFARTSDPLARLREGMRLYVDFGLAHPHHYTVALLLKPGEARASEPAAGHRAFAFMQAAVAGAMAAGAIRAGEVDTTSQTLWAACHGLVALLITIPPDRFAFVPTERLIRHTIDTLIAGVQATAATPPRGAARRAAAANGRGAATLRATPGRAPKTRR